MPLSAEKLASELLTLDPTGDEDTAAMRLAAAYANYAQDATCNGVPLSPSAISNGMLNMQGALSGMSVSGQGAAKITSGIKLFWSSVVPIGFVSATAGVPPPHTALESLLGGVLSANTAGSVGKQESLTNIANAMHSQAIIGGTCTFPGPVVAPIL